MGKQAPLQPMPFHYIIWECPMIKVILKWLAPVIVAIGIGHM
jgi:hypothetical protein